MKQIFLLSFFSYVILNASPLQTHVDVGITGDYIPNDAKTHDRYQAWSFPLNVDFKIFGSPGLSFNLGLSFNKTTAPYIGKNLGNLGDTPDVPFVQWNASPIYPYVSKAFVEYDATYGLFRVGRREVHWGLGIWRNSSDPFLVASTLDGLEWNLQFSSLVFTASLDKWWEGNPNNHKDDFDGYTLQVTTLDEEALSKGFTKKVGLSVSILEQISTTTELNLVDFFAKIYVESFYSGFEILLPTKSRSRSPQYAQLGGQEACSNSDLTCDSQNFDGYAFLWEGKYTFGSESLVWMKSQALLSTAERPESHMIGLKTGLSTGSNSGQSIHSLPLHPAISPGLLMFNANRVPDNNLPGPLVQNAFFVEGAYGYHMPQWGTFEPSLLWAKTNDSAQNNLGIEADLKYTYTDTKGVQGGILGAVWLSGDAFGETREKTCLGLRVFAKTSF